MTQEMIRLKRIENSDFYFESFDLRHFLDSIKIIPTTWFESRIGKDDYWGVRIDFEKTFSPDPYFVLSGLLQHDAIGELWRESGYCSGKTQAKNIDNTGMSEEWSVAKKTQQEICVQILEGYSISTHRQTIKRLNVLSDQELELLSKLHWNNNINILVFHQSQNRCYAVNSQRHLIHDNLDWNASIGLVKNDFLKRLQFEFTPPISPNPILSHEEFKILILANKLQA